jgi:predicted RNA-binding protein with PUA-like domain
MKSEPEAFSIDDLKSRKRASWDGVRNYTSRNFMRDSMKRGDLAFFYHSNADPTGIAGIMEVVQESHPDPTQFDPGSKYFDPKARPDAPRWFLVDVAFRKKARAVIPLAFLKSVPELSKMGMFRLNRLSITPVTVEEWRFLTGLKGHW